MNPQVTVIGCDGRPFGPEATAALARAERVIGAPRHLRLIPALDGKELIELKHLDEALDALGQHARSHRRAGLRRPGLLRHRPRAARPRNGAARHPGRLLGRARLREDRPGLGRRPGALRARPRPAVGARGRAGAPQGRHLDRAGHRPRPRHGTAGRGQAVYAAELLGTAEEKVSVLSAEPALADPNVLISLDPRRRARRAALAGRPPGRPGRLGAARGRVRAPRLDDHQAGGPRARAGPPRPGPRPDDLGRGRGLGFGGGGVRPVRRPRDRDRGGPRPVREDPPQRRASPRPPPRPPRPRAGGAHRPAARRRGLRRRRRPHRPGRRDPARRAPERSWSRWPPSSGSARPPPCSPGRATRPKASSSRPRASTRCRAAITAWPPRTPSSSSGASDDRPRQRHRRGQDGRGAAQPGLAR